MKKLFFGLRPPEAIKAQLYALNQLVPQPTGVSTQRDNLHLTLHFIGQTEQLDCLLQAARALLLPSFEFTLMQWGWFRKPAILWFGPQAQFEPLQQLAAHCRDIAASCNSLGEIREYVPHVTIQRKIHSMPELPQAPELIWRADSFHLFESVSTLPGVRYRSLQRFELAHASAGTQNT